MSGGHGIGIKRNDYHRRNRKRNISMHSRSHGYHKQTNGKVIVSEDSIEIEIIKLPQAKLVKRAKTYWDKTYPDRRAAIQTICFNYVRHHLTNYDELRKPYEKNVHKNIYAYIVKQICNAIADAYPWLVKEARRYYERKVKLRLSKRELQIIKKPLKTLSQEQLEEYNAQEEERWKGILKQFEEEEFQDEVNLTEVLTSLASARNLYFPPFLKPDEIKKRRFESGMNNNDRWWEWEEELQMKTNTARPGWNIKK